MALADIPGYGAFIERKRQNEQKPLAELEQASKVVGLLQHMQQLSMTEKLAGGAGGGMDSMSPDQLDALGQTLLLSGHPSASGVLNIADKKRKMAGDAATLKSMQSGPAKVIQPDVQENEQAADQGTPAVAPAAVPGTPGIFSTLMGSENPLIAAQAKMLQAQMDKSDSRSIAPSYWQTQQSRLAKEQSDYAQQRSMRELTIANRPEPAAQLHVDADGRVLERNRAGQWTLAVGPDGKPISSRGAGVALDEDALKIAGWEKLLWGTDPKGLGQANAQQRAAAQNERARLGKELGLTPTEIAVLPQDNKVKQKAIDKLTTWDATVGRSAEKLDLDLKVAIDYAKKLPLGQVQFINKAVVAGKKEFNDPNANAYATAINSVRQEYARLMSGPTSNAMLPVEAMKKGNELLSSGVDVASLEEVGNQMRRDAGNTKTATRNQIGALRQTMIPTGAPAAPAQGEWSIRPKGG